MPGELELLPVPVSPAASVAGPVAVAGEQVGRVRAELPVVGGLGEREQVLVSAWPVPRPPTRYRRWATATTTAGSAPHSGWQRSRP